MKLYFLIFWHLILELLHPFVRTVKLFPLSQAGAILTAPLFSFGASGKLAKALVFFPWKGLHVVRSYVVPANPQTAGQTTQRGYMTAAVAEWHSVTYNAIDKLAWNRLANLLAAAMSGFNRMVREHVNEVILGNTWESISDASISGVQAAEFSVIVIKAAGGNAPILRWGTSPTNMPESVTMETAGGSNWIGVCSGLSASTLYYFTIEVGSTGADWGRLGIYTQRTIA